MAVTYSQELSQCKITGSERRRPRKTHSVFHAALNAASFGSVFGTLEALYG
jgi:hypothetical protein